MKSENIVGNFYNKYTTSNPIARWMTNNFLKSVSEHFNQFKPKNFLEVGCGEGYLANYLVDNSFEKLEKVIACDLDLNKVEKDLNPLISFQEGSVYELPFDDNEFDLVVCCEVLEHLEKPELALKEIARVSGRAVIISTPWEPVWCILNMMRGKYLTDFGNTPGHIQHFSRRDLLKLARRELGVEMVKKPIPWTIISGNVNSP